MYSTPPATPRVGSTPATCSCSSKSSTARDACSDGGTNADAGQSNGRKCGGREWINHSRSYIRLTRNTRSGLKNAAWQLYRRLFHNSSISPCTDLGYDLQHLVVGPHPAIRCYSQRGSVVGGTNLERVVTENDGGKSSSAQTACHRGQPEVRAPKVSPLTLQMR